MAKSKSENGAVVARRTLAAPTFAAISAVEGLKLSATSRSRIEELSQSDLTPDERRAAILRAYTTQPKLK